MNALYRRSKAFPSALNSFCILILFFLTDCNAEVRELNGLSNVTIVSGYWSIKSKHSISDYENWFSKAMKINAPTIFYYDSDDVKNLISKCRQDLPIQFVPRSLESMKGSWNYDPNWIHKMHVPTAELALIWLDKVNMIVDAIKTNYYDSDWFAWVDAGIAEYRSRPPPNTPWPSNLALFESLPHDKIIYTGTDDYDRHVFAGTAFMYHKSIATEVAKEFLVSYKQCIEKEGTTKKKEFFYCGSDQVVFSLLLEREPSLFHKIGMGYGKLVSVLYK